MFVITMTATVAIAWVALSSSWGSTFDTKIGMSQIAATITAVTARPSIPRT